MKISEEADEMFAKERRARQVNEAVHIKRLLMSGKAEATKLEERLAALDSDADPLDYDPLTGQRYK